MAAPCYNGPNPIKDEDRLAIWKWAKENGVDKGLPIEQVSRAINDHFFGGQAKQSWINDLLSGRKTPFKQIATDAWKKQYNRRVITQNAADMSRMAAMGPVGKIFKKIWTVPRSITTFGHGVVFPVSHAGELITRPTSWGTFIKGALRTYRAAYVPSALGGGKAYTGRMLAGMEGDSLHDLALHSKLEIGSESKPTGFISSSGKGPSQRAWDALKVMRYELWKKQMERHLKPGMSTAEALDFGKQYAEWANNATGAGSGRFATLVGETAFGPKLTQSKLNRLTYDPYQTGKTLLNWDEATPGQRAVAMTRLSGSTQFAVTTAGFLALNAGLLSYFGSKEKINFTDPFKGDFWSFKSGNGLEGYIPGMHTEIKTLAKLMAVAFASKKPPGWMPAKLAAMQADYQKSLRGEGKFGAVAKTGGQYLMGKATPAIQRGLELGLRQDYQGRPLPFSEEPGTEKTPKLSYGEYIGDIGPIPTSGVIGHVYDEFQKSGMSKADSLATVGALIIYGAKDPKSYEIGVPGFFGLHARDVHGAGEPTAGRGGVTREAVSRESATREILTR